MMALDGHRLRDGHRLLAGDSLREDVCDTHNGRAPIAHHDMHPPVRRSMFRPSRGLDGFSVGKGFFGLACGRLHRCGTAHRWLQPVRRRQGRPRRPGRPAAGDAGQRGAGGREDDQRLGRVRRPRRGDRAGRASAARVGLPAEGRVRPGQRSRPGHGDVRDRPGTFPGPGASRRSRTGARTRAGGPRAQRAPAHGQAGGVGCGVAPGVRRAHLHRKGHRSRGAFRRGEPGDREARSRLHPCAGADPGPQRARRGDRWQLRHRRPDGAHHADEGEPGLRHVRGRRGGVPAIQRDVRPQRSGRIEAHGHVGRGGPRRRAGLSGEGCGRVHRQPREPADWDDLRARGGGQPRPALHARPVRPGPGRGHRYLSGSTDRRSCGRHRPGPPLRAGGRPRWRHAVPRRQAGPDVGRAARGARRPEAGRDDHRGGPAAGASRDEGAADGGADGPEGTPEARSGSEEGTRWISRRYSSTVRSSHRSSHC